MIRKPVVAGSFYAGEPNRLRKQIEQCFLSDIGPGSLPEANPRGPGQIVGLVSPHAGYAYSGPVAAYGAYFLARDQVPSVVVILGPNHTGMGSDISVQVEGSWITPLGEVEIESELARLILENCSEAREDDSAHTLEHSIEVQLPFLQYAYGTTFKFVPVCLLDQSLDACKRIGPAVAKALKSLNIADSAVTIASSDFTHYESHENAAEKDKHAIDAILRLDPEDLMHAVLHYNISMCGPGPVAAMLLAAKDLGATKAELLTHKTSGDASGDYSAVVGYASIIVER